MAAALAHAQAGHEVHVFEAARTLGGRARAVHGALPDGTPLVLDNGQHVLIGAYQECLRLMALVGIDAGDTLLRLPLTLQFPDGQGLRLPRLPPPLDALVGIARARGWGWHDKLSLLQTATAWQWRGFRCAPQASVADLCRSLTPRLMAEFIEPLCVSALNTPAERASGTVFLRVLKDSLFSGRGGSNLLIPRTDLSSLFPDSAARWLEGRGGVVHAGVRVQALHRQGRGGWRIATPSEIPGRAAADLSFESIELACPAREAARLVGSTTGLSTSDQAAAASWAAQAQALDFTAIATVYLYAPRLRLPLPMVALRSGPEAPAQFVFDRGQLGGPTGLTAWVISNSPTDHRDALTAHVVAQARSVLAPWGLRSSDSLQTIATLVDKRATFACTPGLQRPARSVVDGLTACGDYVEGPYPATLEGAVRRS